MENIEIAQSHLPVPLSRSSSPEPLQGQEIVSEPMGSILKVTGSGKVLGPSALGQNPGRDDLPSPDLVERGIQHLDDQTKMWLDAHRMHEQLGLEGMSSDDSEVETPERYVRAMSWRSHDVVKHYKKIDLYRKKMTKWGKYLPGTKPPTRHRIRGAPSSSRPPPTGKPINLYDAEWYAGLTHGQRVDLKAKAAMNFLIEADD